MKHKSSDMLNNPQKHVYLFFSPIAAIQFHTLLSKLDQKYSKESFFYPNLAVVTADID